MPRDRVDGPFDEVNEAFARGVLEGEARATREQPREPRRRRQRPVGALVAIAAIIAAVLVTWMVTRSQTAMEQNQNVDVGRGEMPAPVFHTSYPTEPAVLEDAVEPAAEPAGGTSPGRTTTGGGAPLPAPQAPAQPQQLVEQPAQPQQLEQQQQPTTPLEAPAATPTPEPAEAETPIRDLVGGLVCGLELRCEQTP